MARPPSESAPPLAVDRTPRRVTLARLGPGLPQARDAMQASDTADPGPAGTGASSRALCASESLRLSLAASLARVTVALARGED